MSKEISKTQKALNLWAVILIIWSIYRANFKMPDWFDEFLAKPLIFILPVYYYITKIEKKSFFKEMYLGKKQVVKDLIIGLGIGGLFLLSAIFGNFIKYKKFIFFPTPLATDKILFFSLMALATGISEEILSRGFVLKKLYEESKNILTASFFASLLFFFLHVPMLFTNIKITGNLLLLFMVTDICLSLVLSFIYLSRKSLILPILIHAFYNLVIVLFI